MNFDDWKTTDPDDVLDKYPTHCDLHNEHRPCQQCLNDFLDRQWQETLEEK